MSWTIRPWSCRALGSFLRRRRVAAAPAPPLFAPLARRQRLWRAPAAILVTLATLVSGLAVTGGVAAADTASTFSPPDLFNLSALQLPATVAGEYYPGGIYSATPAQIASLQALEQEAIANTISDHALAPSDADAVDSWARSDADAELWAVLVQAIQAVQAGTADTDQQNAVAWLTSVVQRQGVLAAQDAGLEYTKWAGLGTSTYQNLIATNASESALSNFLSGTPLPYTDGGSATDPSASVDGGYCVYQSPAPFQGDYTANVYTKDTPQTCFTPCTNVLGCLAPTPNYSQFLEWGDADANDQVFNNAAFATDAKAIALGASMGTVATVGATAAGLGTAFALGTSSVLASTAFQTLIFPWAAVANGFTVREAVGAAIGAGEDAEEALQAAVAAAEEVGGAVAATGVGVIVAAAIFAIATAVQEGLSVFTAAQLPGQLAQDIAGAPTATYDLGSMLSSGQAGGLYSLFVGSTEPDPTFRSCDNGGSTAVVTFTFSSATAPCLNPTPVPAEESYDPQWVVTPQGSTTSTTQPTITVSDAATQLTSDVYLHGNWFVSTATINGTQGSAMSLRLQYTDWSGNEETAWLFDNAATPEFVVVNDADLGSSFDPSTCLNGGGGCSITQSIDYVDGNSDYSASVAPGGAEAPALPPDPTPASEVCSNNGNAPLCTTLSPTTTTLTASPSTPSVGQQVTLTATLDGTFATGTVDFTDGSTDLCSDELVQNVTTVSPGSGPVTPFEVSNEATCTTTFSQAGAHYVFATYSGDNNPVVADEPSQGELTLDVTNQAATSTSVSADTTTPVVGQLATYTATVSDYPGGPTPGGTVTFASGSNTLCSDVQVSAGGTAACAWAFQAPGSDTVTASYSGDANTLASSGQTTATVGQATTQTQLSLQSASRFPGQVFTYQATVVPETADGPAPTGTVTFANGSTTVCANVALPTTAPFTATCAVTYNAAGNKALTATYSGDSNYTGSSGQSAVSVSLAGTSTSVSASPSAPVVGQAVSYTATVTSSASGDANPPSPTGTVTFTNGNDNTVCSNVALSPNGTATCNQTYGGPGPETVTASYSGDDATMASSGQAGVSVAKASSSTLVVPSVPAPVVGQPVTYTATVAAAAPDTSGPVPTGTVTFTNGNNALCSGLVLTATASASCTQAYSAPGPETVAASYSGDNANLPSSGQAAVAVSQASTTTALTATATGVVGQPITYTASVSVEAADTDGPAPTGTVSFSNGQGTVCANVPLSSNGTASCAESYQSPGPEALTANYSGDTANLGSSGQATVIIDPASTTTSLSASTSTPVVGQPVTYTASVSVEQADTDGPAPTGTVTFGNGQGTVCANVAVSPTGTATCDLPYSSTGPEKLTATYSGDTANLGSSGQASVTVGQASTTTSLLASSASTTFGQSVTLTAQVSPTAPSTQGPPPSGTVSFTLDGEAVGSPVPLSLGLAVSPPLTNLAPGAHQLTATYSGDANYNGSQGSTSETVTCSQTITTSTRGPVHVTGSTCLERGSISGKVTIRSGGNLALVGGSVNGPITGRGAASVLVCGTTVHGSITLTGPTGPVQLGGASGSSCAPDRLYGPLTVFRAEAATSIAGTAVAGPVAVVSSKGPVSLKGDRISGPVDVTSNTAGVTVTNDTITRSLTVTSNSSPVVVSSNSVGGEVVFEHNTSPSGGPVSANTVSANTVGGALECAGNAPAPVDAGTANQATRGAHGQCASLV